MASESHIDLFQELIVKDSKAVAKATPDEIVLMKYAFYRGLGKVLVILREKEVAFRESTLDENATVDDLLESFEREFGGVIGNMMNHSNASMAVETAINNLRYRK